MLCAAGAGALPWLLGVFGVFFMLAFIFAILTRLPTLSIVCANFYLARPVAFRYT